MVKTITIRDEVDRKLLIIKGKEESFSELFDRLVECTSPVETLKNLEIKSNSPTKKQCSQNYTLKELKKDLSSLILMS